MLLSLPDSALMQNVSTFLPVLIKFWAHSTKANGFIYYIPPRKCLHTCFYYTNVATWQACLALERRGGWVEGFSPTWGTDDRWKIRSPMVSQSAFSFFLLNLVFLWLFFLSMFVCIFSCLWWFWSHGFIFVFLSVSLVFIQVCITVHALLIFSLRGLKVLHFSAYRFDLIHSKMQIKQLNQNRETS